ncbi:amidohydrolase family protein [Desulforamulus ferrireducens]|uniref:Amidohydrolase n=1 Tax=Desulforamulus ferrireducens TaxID=1833852 RepID=A0A1S6ISX5_9FIRM|nr:amidohydrolase family protein [Desulforamulus ferrireducens]AQS57883.1 amidohydrolase [Desulforamulus ferrireducens]
MKVIDFRFRPHTPDVMAIGQSKMFKALCDSINFSAKKTQPLEEIVEDMDRHGIEKAVILGRDAETTYQWKGSNDGVASFVNSYPDKFIGFAGLDPHKGMAAVRELSRSVNELGLKGASIDPYLAQIYVNDAKYYPIYAKCCELNIPIVITTGPASLVPNAVIDHVAPRYIDFVARDFPELTIIVSHGAYPWVNEMITVAQRNANVYFDMSEYEFFPMAEAYVQAANTIISDKLLFASAHPFVDFKDALQSYQKLPFTDEVREKVMYKNAARILGL